MVRHVPIGHFYVVSLCASLTRSRLTKFVVRVRAGPSAQSLFKKSSVLCKHGIFFWILKYLGVARRGRWPRFSGTLTNFAKTNVDFDVPTRNFCFPMRERILGAVFVFFCFNF